MLVGVDSGYVRLTETCGKQFMFTFDRQEKQTAVGDFFVVTNMLLMLFSICKVRHQTRVH